MGGGVGPERKEGGAQGAGRKRSGGKKKVKKGKEG